MLMMLREIDIDLLIHEAASGSGLKFGKPGVEGISQPPGPELELRLLGEDLGSGDRVCCHANEARARVFLSSAGGLSCRMVERGILLRTCARVGRDMPSLRAFQLITLHI